jgi:hypothetical protein
MFRSVIPFILALIGLPIIFLAYINPLFDWQISEVITDLPSSHKVNVSPSPWQTWLGDSLEDKSYVFQKLYVSENGKACSTRDLNFIVKRSRSDEILERLSLLSYLNDDTIYLVIWWILIEIALSIAYIFWFTFWHEHRTFSYAMISAGFAMGCFCFIMLPMMKLMGPRIGSFGGSASCHGTITFSAELLNVHYLVPILLFVGIFAEFAALGMMVRQIVVTVRK